MIEQIFNQRYHLEDRLGEGGTAVVWRGMDALLRRRVAVKVLRPQYASDAEFVRRFYHEAESAARLSHPNVVSVYDVGRENDAYYIVMELVDGTTLAERIAAEGALSERAVVDLGLQICSGLGYAHRQNLLHRDVKPANILLTRDDIVKISDFGIARAAERQTIVMTRQGHFMGSVAYLSPEQAQDHELTPASDLYSLGVVLYECLCGHPPFAGESPIALALKHVSEPAPELPATISPPLATLVMRLLRKNPAERYASAEEVTAALRGVRDAVSTVAPDVAPVPARPAPTIAIDVPNPPPRRSPLPDRPAVAAPLPAPAPARETSPRRRGFPLVTLLALLVLAMVAAGAIFVMRPFAAPVTRAVAVPSVVGAPIGEAEKTLRGTGFAPRIESAGSETVPAENVISQDPGAGAIAQGGSIIKLVVSSGLPVIEVPNLVAFSVDDAKRLLDDQHLRSSLTHRFDAKAPKGAVLSQKPAAHAKIRARGIVALEISDGPKPIAVPGLVAKSVDAARARLKSLGLILNVTDQIPSDAIAQGTIASQDPPEGANAPAGSVVSVQVSAGAAMVTVPALTDLKVGDAVKALQAAGFVPKISYSAQAGTAGGAIIGQNPGEGSSARHGATVEIVAGVAGTVPDVAGMSLEAARAALSDSGYVVGNVAQTQEGEAGKIARTEPVAGTALRPGESVELYQNLNAPDSAAPASTP